MATKNKTAVTQLFDIIKGVAQYSEDNPFLNQILMAEKRLLEIDKQQKKEAYNAGYRDCDSGENCLMGGDISQFNNAESYFNKTYGGDNE